MGGASLFNKLLYMYSNKESIVKRVHMLTLII